MLNKKQMYTNLWMFIYLFCLICYGCVLINCKFTGKKMAHVPIFSKKTYDGKKFNMLIKNGGQFPYEFHMNSLIQKNK